MIIDYEFANRSEHARHMMDLLAAKRRYARRWSAAEIGAFFCFAVAGGILVASLLLPPTHQAASENGLAASISAAPAR